MPDIVPTPLDGNVTQDPRSSAGGQVIQSGFSELAQGLDKLAVPFQRASVEQESLKGQGAVYTDENGDVKYTTENPLSLAGAAYNRSARTAALSQISMDARVSVANLQAEAGGDLGEFDKLSKLYLKGVLSKQDPLMRGPVMSELSNIVGNSRIGLVQQQVSRDTQSQFKTMQAQMGLLDDEAASLARTGGTGTPEYAQKMDAIKTLQDEMVANPLFGYSQDQADVASKRMVGDHMANAIVGQVEDTFHKQGLQAATDFAQKAFLDPNLDLSMTERNSFKNVAMSAIRGFKYDQMIAKQEAQGEAAPMLDGMKNGQTFKDEDVYSTAQHLAAAGDIKGSLQLLRYNAISQQKSTFGTMSKEEQAKALASGSVGDSAIGGTVDRIIGIESGGNPNAQNPNSSASGLGQILDSTWLSTIKKSEPDIAAGKTDEQLLALKKDPVLSRKITGDLANENAGILTAGGQAATPGNIYLSHFAGPQGALNLLRAPAGASAESILGSDVINANPQLRGMAASDVVAWANQKMTGVGNVDPEVYKAMNKQVASDARTLFTSMKDGMKKGEQIPADELVLLGKELGAIGDKDFTDEVTTTLKQYGQYSTMSLQGMDAMISATEKGGVSASERDAYEMMKSIHDQTVSGLDKDPIDLASKRGVVEPLKPLDFSNPMATAKSLGDRQAAATKTAMNYNMPAGVSALTADEASSMGQQIQNGPPGQKAQFFSMLQSGLDDKTYMATMAKLAPNMPPAYAVAGGLFARNPGVATSVLNGVDALKQTPNLIPAKSDIQDNADKLLPITAFAGNGQYRNALIDAATARYADLSLAAGDTKAVYNQPRMTQAMNDVTGGLVSFNGSKTFPPRFGMSQDDFNTTMKNLSPGAFEGAVTASGAPINSTDIIKNGILKSYRDGQYLVQLGNNSAAGATSKPYVMTASGQPFILDLSDRAQRMRSVEASPPPVIQTASNPRVPGGMGL